MRGSDFVTENTGFIKDFYKISSCIGRGKPWSATLTPFPFFRAGRSLDPYLYRRVWRGEEMSAQGDQGAASRQDNKQKVPRGGREGQAIE